MRQSVVRSVTCAGCGFPFPWRVSRCRRALAGSQAGVQRAKCPAQSESPPGSASPSSPTAPGSFKSKLAKQAKRFKEEAAAKKLFDRASEVLGYDLLDVCVNGPAEKLNSTVVSQPAIFVASMAAVEDLRSQEGGQEVIDSANVAAGLSLGEYTALCFAGAMSFEDGLKIVKARGEAMQAAADSKPTAMCSVIGLKADKVEELCQAATEAAARLRYIHDRLNWDFQGSLRCRRLRQVGQAWGDGPLVGGRSALVTRWLWHCRHCRR